MTDGLKLLKRGKGIGCRALAEGSTLDWRKDTLSSVKSRKRGKMGSEVVHFLCWLHGGRKGLIFIILLARK